MDAELKFTVGDPDEDFFEQNPHWRYLDSTVDLKEKFGERTSKIRWALYLILDPDSKYHRYPFERRVEIVNNNYLTDSFGFQIELDEEDPDKIVNEELLFAVREYPKEIMAKVKREYYERERSYQQLLRMERESTKLAEKYKTQQSFTKIFADLEELRREAFKESAEIKAKAAGAQQPGILFTN